MTNEEIVDWLGAEVGFEKSDGPAANLNKEELVAIKNAIVEKNRHIEEMKAKNSEYAGRIGRLKQMNEE